MRVEGNGTTNGGAVARSASPNAESTDSSATQNVAERAGLIANSNEAAYNAALEKGGGATGLKTKPGILVGSLEDRQVAVGVREQSSSFVTFRQHLSYLLGVVERESKIFLAVLALLAVSFVFPQAVAKHGERAVFAFFAAICGAAWLFVRAAVDETRGANLEDIAAK